MTRVSVPDGKGGFTEVEGEVVSGRQSKSEERVMAERDEHLEREAVEHAERLLRIETVHAEEANLSPQQRMLAMCIAWGSMYDGYPRDKAEADETMRRAWEVIEESKKVTTRRASRRPASTDPTDVKPGGGSFRRVDR